MKLTRRPNRRLAAALAILSSAAVLIAVVSMEAASGTASAQPARPATAGRCLTRHIDAWYAEPGNGAAGSTYWDIELSNVGSHACSLDGFPGLVALSVSGPQLGSPAAHLTGHSPHLVTLAPGGTAHVILRSIDPGFLSTCHATKAGVLQLTPPGQHASVLVGLQIGACKNPGPIFMYVGPVEGGVGIPGYTSI